MCAVTLNLKRNDAAKFLFFFFFSLSFSRYIEKKTS